MKTLLALTAVLAFALTGCSAARNSISKEFKGYSSGHYLVTVWSGGKAVRTYDVDGFINSEKDSDGWYFIQFGKLIRVSGEVTIEQQ